MELELPHRAARMEMGMALLLVGPGALGWDGDGMDGWIQTAPPVFGPTSARA